MKLGDILTWETVAGESLQVGELTLTPHAQALRLRLPFGGGVWNRPVALSVARDGEVTTVPIVDVTRLAQVGMYGLALVIGLVMWLILNGLPSARKPSLQVKAS